MSFVGKLDQFKLPDLLQIISATDKTGKLSLTRRDSQGVIVFRRGKIIYAASSAARETLGNLLLCQGLIDEQGLANALEIQHRATDEKRLGTILVESGLVSEETLRQVISRQIEAVISEFLQWEGGFFKFDLLRLPDQGEIEVDAKDFVHREGLSTQKVLLDISTRLDELEREASAADESAGGQAPEPPPDRSRLESLKSIMSEIRSPQFTGEATGKILAFARQALARGALFLVRRDGFHAMSVFGPELAGREKRVAKKLSLPLEKSSVVAEAADRKEPYRGPLEDNTANRSLINALGGGKPAEVVAIPLVANDLALLVLYGDNGPRPIEGFEQLELLLLQAGLAMERNLLRKRLEVLEGRRSR